MMKKFVFLFGLLMCCAMSSYAQTQDEDVKVYDVVEKMPQFEGGDSVMVAWLNEHINYPKIAEFRKIEGRVFVRFIVEKDGSIGEIQLARSVDPWLDQEAMRVVKSMPKWIPGKQNGKPVRVWYTLPVHFKLNGANSDKMTH
ncbi:MAG: energy transducer TonB [Bacteroidaceae bacterium]|nr:energy transducer TonB [Bacteroidaceae bacterium]